MSCAGACGCVTRENPVPEVLLRPEFFCGQLLTDADMTALTTWARGRLRLAAQRTGWGVVCGLSVVGDPKRRSRVTVRPGVAVSSCGQDVLVPADAVVNLSGAAPGLGAPCDRPVDPATPPTDCVVDVGIRYREEGRLPVLGIGRGDCAPPADCVDSRSNEGYELVATAVTDTEARPDGGWTEWHDGYAEVVAFLDKAMDLNLENTPAAAEWLKDEWRRSGSTRFPRLGARIDDWQKQNTEAQFAELLFWVAQDRVLTYLETACLPACPPPRGDDCGCESSAPVVPLARVWLHNDEGTWVVTAIDDQPPYRRRLSTDRPAQPEGGVNLGHVIWRDRKDAARLVRRAGVGVTGVTQWQPDSRAAVRDQLQQPPATDEDTITVLYLDVPEWAAISGYRAIGLSSVTTGGTTGTGEAEQLAGARPRRTHARVPVPAVPDASARRRGRQVPTLAEGKS